MELIRYFIDLFLHLDVKLKEVIDSFGNWTYFILGVVIFCETGLVVTPILPGDSLLFAAGTFAALGSLKVAWLFGLLGVAAILGDTVNYWVGHILGPKVFTREDVWYLNKKYLEETHRFYEKWGAETIIIARFMPIIRTFAPFVAGIGSMSYGKFLAYNMIGGILWVATFVFGGYYFGNIPVVKKNFTLVIMAIIIISVLPGVIKFLQEYLRSRAASKTKEPAP
jgi:membrane-associated protein